MTNTSLIPICLSQFSHLLFSLPLQMKPILFSSLLFSSLIILAFADDPPLKADEHPSMDCFPTTCGNITITYPFWVEEKQPSYCGFPNFKLSCKNDIPILKIPYEVYQVKEIFYDNQSLLFVNEDFVKRDCPSLQWNIFFSLTPFNISSLNRELVFLFDCSEPPHDYYEISCNGTTYAKFANWGEDLGNLGTCQSAFMPVVDHLGVDIKDYLRVAKNGFLAEWTAANCTDCRESDGQCGYSEKNKNFMCICPDRAHSRSCSGKRNTWKIIAAAVAGVGGAFILGFCLVLFLYNRRKRQRQASLSNLLSQSSSSKISSKNDPEFGENNSYNTHIFTYDELQEATNNFSESRELGDGGFGTVYKGKLRDGRTVAVKRLYENNYRRLEQFKNEVDILSRLRHQNLVSLYGCTSGRSRELLLVYEYIPNGTLADHLHGTLTSKEPLPWPVRMSIAIETADALAYLHAVEPQIIHRDVKTNNILLDNNFHVKVADFGLSRLFPLDATHVSTAPQGTPGYVDPEYHQCYQLTDKSDVYSFGVVLVELISSKPAVDISRHRHEINLANMAITKIQNGQIDQLVDPELGYQLDLEITCMINQVAELAFRCLQSDREMRPCIKEVLEVLSGIECGGKKAEKDHAEVNEVHTKEETRLLKNVMPFSPDTVAEQWSSNSTTPNTSA